MIKLKKKMKGFTKTGYLREKMNKESFIFSLSQSS